MPRFRLYPPGTRGPCWYVRGTDSSGEYEVSTGKDTERAAARWVEEILLPDRASRRVPGAGETVGFKRAAAAYKAASPHLSRIDIRLVDAVAAEIGDMDCRSVVHATLVAAADALQPGRADSTRNRKVIAPAAAVLHYAAQQQWCEYRRLPKFRESRKSNRTPASDATMAALLAHLEDPPRAHRNGRKGDPNLAHKKLLLAMLYELGLRISDYLRIGWDQVDLPAGKVTVRIAKTDEWATLQVSAHVVAMLANLPVKRGRLFPWSEKASVYKWLRRVRERAGVHYTPHLSRHALATAADAAGIPDKRAAELGVWRDVRSLHRYQHVRPEPIAGRDAGFLLLVKKVGS